MEDCTFLVKRMNSIVTWTTPLSPLPLFFFFFYGTKNSPLIRTMFSREYAGKKSWKGVGYIERALYSYRSYLRNVSGYRRYIYIHGLLEFVRLSFPFAHRVYFSYDILLQFSTVRDHLARRIHHQDFIVYDITFLRKSSTNGVIHETPCTRYARYRIMCVDSRMNPRWISSLEGSKTSVPRIKSKKIREGWVGHGGGREEKEEGRRS